MHVSRLGLTPLKGARHTERPSLDLTEDGPVEDRVFCLVDLARGRVLRSVEHPLLQRVDARWHDGVLSTELPGTTVAARPVATGDVRRLDYWGRDAEVELLAGPWAEAFSDHLGLPVRLARATRRGGTVYAGPVSLVTTSSLLRLAEELGVAVDPARFRATVTLDTGDLPAHPEDGWAGRRLRLGDAEVEVRDGLPRCAVIDHDPGSGRRTPSLLAALAGYRRRRGEVVFGVDAVVVRPGRVRLGDPAELRGERRRPLTVPDYGAVDGG